MSTPAHEPHFDCDAVRAALTARAILDRFGIKFHDMAGQHCTNHCVRCGQRSRKDAFKISIATGLWRCFVCGAGGDKLALLAGYAALGTTGDDFKLLVQLAADIAGVSPDLDSIELDRRVRERREADARLRIEREAEEVQRVADGKLRASSEMQRLRRTGQTHAAGAAYARSRRIDPRVVEAGHLLFAGNGDLCVPLWGYDGELVNVVRRVLEPRGDEPKVKGLYGCTTAGTLAGRIQEIDGGDAMLVEGVADSLTAATIWPNRTILGAHGAGKLPEIARRAAPVVKTKHGRLHIVPDADDTGQAWALKAGEAAIAAGLVMDRDLFVVDIEPHADLNAAWCAGWRP